MRSGIQRSAIGVLIFFLSASMFAVAQTPLRELSRVRYPRIEGLGGAHPTLTGDLSVIQTNPAGLFSDETTAQFATLGTNVTGPVFSLASLLVSGADDPVDILESDEALDFLRNITAISDTAGPIGFGYTGGGVGYSVHSALGTSLTAPRSGTLRYGVSQRLVFRGGYAAPLPMPATSAMSLDAGFVVSAFVQGESADEFPLIEVADLFDDIGLDLILDAPFVLRSSFGLNLGLLWSYADTLSVGLVGENLYAPAIETEYESVTAFVDSEEPVSGETTYLLPPEVNVGARYSVGLGPLSRYIDEIDLYASYFDALDFLTRSNPRHPLLKFAIGTEIRLLEIMRMRLAFSEGLPSTGFGLRLGAFDVNGAVYGRELSSEPGLRSVYNVGFSIDIRL